MRWRNKAQQLENMTFWSVLKDFCSVGGQYELETLFFKVCLLLSLTPISFLPESASAALPGARPLACTFTSAMCSMSMCAQSMPAGPEGSLCLVKSGKLCTTSSILTLWGVLTAPCRSKVEVLHIFSICQVQAVQLLGQVQGPTKYLILIFQAAQLALLCLCSYHDHMWCVCVWSQ